MMEAQLALGRTDEVLRRARDTRRTPGPAHSSSSRPCGKWCRSGTCPSWHHLALEVIALLDLREREDAARGEQLALFPVRRYRRRTAAGGTGGSRRHRGRLVPDAGGSERWAGMLQRDSGALRQRPAEDSAWAGPLAAAGWPVAPPGPLLCHERNTVVKPPIRSLPGRALLPSDAVAIFQVAGARSRLGQVVWSSPVEELDCTIVRLEGPPPAQPLELAKQPVTCKNTAVALLHHRPSGGGDLEFSLQDNRLLGCDARLLHYRTPTEGGSSGSPVFDDGWRVVGLHRAGDAYLARLTDSPAPTKRTKKLRLRQCSRPPRPPRRYRRLHSDHAACHARRRYRRAHCP